MFYFILIFYFAKNTIKIFVFDPHCHGAEKLDEATIGVVDESFVPGLRLQTSHGIVIEAQVQDGVHHARHGDGGA